jgi:hypothetical protein
MKSMQKILSETSTFILADGRESRLPGINPPYVRRAILDENVRIGAGARIGYRGWRTFAATRLRQFIQASDPLDLR